MPSFYTASNAQFLMADEDSIVGRLTTVTQAGMTELSAEQLDAWRQQIRILRDALRPDCMQHSHLILEYQIPRRGKRIEPFRGSVGLGGPGKAGCQISWN